MTRAVPRWVLMAALALSGVLFSARSAQADDLFAHVVRPGDTLASIAQRYYGDLSLIHI